MPDRVPGLQVSIGKRPYWLMPTDNKSINVWRIVGEMCKAYLDDPSIFGDREWRVLLKGFCDKTKFGLGGFNRGSFEEGLNKLGGNARLHVLRRLSRPSMRWPTDPGAT